MRQRREYANWMGLSRAAIFNAVENSPRNFTAFKALATTLNGTNTTGASSSSSSGNGASTGVAFSSALSLGALVAAAAVLL